MSILNKPPVKVIDARLSWEASKEVACLDGPSQMNWQVFPAQSRSTSNQVYQVNVPSLQTGMSKLVLYHWVGTAEWGCTNSGEANMSSAVVVGLADEGESQVISNESVQIGSKTNNILRSQCGVELARINQSVVVDEYFKSGSGALKDSYTNFRAWANTNKNVLAMPYDINNGLTISPRTSDIRVNLLGDSATTMSVDFDIYFTSQVSPFCQTAEGDTCAIRNLNNVIFTLTLESQLTRLFSVLNTSDAITDITFGGLTFNTCEMLVQFITPSPWSLKNYTPQNDIYNYAESQVWLVQGVTCPKAVSNNSRTTVTFSTQQITGSVIPDYLIIGARPRQSSLPLSGALEPRLWFSVVGNQLYFNNQQILNGATQRQLYDLSTKNGLSQVTFEQFLGRDVTYIPPAEPSPTNTQVLGGSFLVINPARDCQIVQNASTNGCIENWSLTGSINVQNQTYTDYTDTELVIVAVYSGFLVSNGKVSTTIGTITKEQVLECFNNADKPITDIHLHHMSGQGMSGYTGGAFGSFFKKLASGAVNLAKHAYANKDTLKDIYSGFKNAYQGRGYSAGAILDTSDKALSNKRELARNYMRS